jgi:nitroreductase
VAAVPSRLSHRYGAKAEEFVQIGVGHASQNILLQAAALGLAAVPVGSLDPSRAADTLALPPDQTVLYLIPRLRGRIRAVRVGLMIPCYIDPRRCGRVLLVTE